MSHRFVLIGHPVGHSISPAIHQYAYELLGIEAAYGLADCPTESDVERVVQRIREGELHGANVTVPWKQAAFDLADSHDQTALDVGVANVLARTDAGKIIAYNTDASALGTELSRALTLAQVDRRAKPGALVIGSGGAALAAVVGCRLAGVSEVWVSARRYDPNQERSSWPRCEPFEELGACLLSWPTFDPNAWSEALPKTGLVIQATSAGMKGKPGGEELAALIPWSKLQGAVAYDLVYTPPLTPFLAQAEAAGIAAVGGLGMLVGQAADAIEIWLGKSPNPEDLVPTAKKVLGL